MTRRYLCILILNTIVYLFAISANAQMHESEIIFNDGTKEIRTLSLHHLQTSKISELDYDLVSRISSIKTIVCDSSIFEFHKCSFTESIKDRSENLSSKTTKDTVLILEKLVDGTISFYQLKLSEGDYRYYVGKESVIHELVKEKTIEENITVVRDKYKGILNLLFYDCDNEDISNTNSIKYRGKIIQKKIISYNQACGELNYHKQRPSYKIYISPIVAIAHHRSKFSGSTASNSWVNSFLDAEKVNSTTIQLGAYVRIPIVQKKNTVSLILHSLYSNKVK